MLPGQPSSVPAVPLSLRRMALGDLPFATEAHRKHFPQNVMGRLGRPFLRRYYRSFIESAQAAATVAEIDGQICGYLVGILDTREHRSWLLRRHGSALAVTALPGLVFHPRLTTAVLARRVTRRLQRAFRPCRSGRHGEVQGAVAVLSHVAVTEDARGRGVGHALVQEFVNEARVFGCDRIALATVDGPGGAGPFYERRGWQLQARTRTADGRWIRLYDLKLRGAD